MDSMEAVWWGKFCVWGTNKHPPLSGFPAYGIYLLFSENIKAVYILSQICITVGFCFIYKLASLLLEQRKAVLSVMLLEGCVFMDFVLRNTMLMLCRWLFGLLLHISFTGP